MNSSRYSHIRDIDYQLKDFCDDEEEITRKIIIPQKEKKDKLDPDSIAKIMVVKCRKEYEDFYPTKIHAFILKMESNEAWFGIHVKEPYYGEIEWSKNVWEEIVSFDLYAKFFTS